MISDKTIEEVRQLRLAQEADLEKEKRQTVYGTLYNEKWMLFQDGGRIMVRNSEVEEMLTDPYGHPILGWAGYERKNGTTRFYGDISAPLEYAIRFIQGEEVEVLT